MNLENSHCLGSTSSHGNSNSPRYARICYEPIQCMNDIATRMKMPGWRALWRKIKKEKKRFFSSSPEFHVQYDPNSYSQNFDDGHGCFTDPDNVSRSFSARFAVPSRIFEDVG